MAEAIVKIKNKIGLHARPAAQLVSQASKFKSDMKIKKGEKETNLKSIMGVLSLGVNGGEEVIITASGKDENEAINTIVELIEKLED